MAEPRIELRRVSKYFPGNAGLIDVSVSVEAGEMLLVTGPSGAGKTTLLKMIYAAERPDVGEVRVDGRDITRLDPSSLPFLRRNVGVVFQEGRLVQGRTVAENVAIALEVRGVRRREVKSRVAQALEWVGLLSVAQARPGRLSGGERQRVAVARALVGDPAILIADEPTLHLDPDAAKEVTRLLGEAAGRGTTVLIATHDRWVEHLLNNPRVMTLVRGRQSNDGPRYLA